MIALADELERLSQALALNEGFQLVILECHDLESWDLYRLFDVVQARVAELRGTPPLVLIYDPYLTTDETGSLRDEAWVEGTLGPLLELPARTSASASLVAVLDGTRFATTDGDELPSWIYLFHRLNEQRNAIARALEGTLALALPSALVSLFLDEAPDSASIRSGYFHLDPIHLPEILPPLCSPTPPEYRYEQIYDASLRRHAADPDRDATERTWARKHFIVRPPGSQPSPPADYTASRESEPVPHKSVAQLLLSLFSSDELRRFIRYLSNSDDLTAELPGASASPAVLVHEAVQVLERHGLLSDPQFWDQMLAVRPRRRLDIDAVRTYFQPSSSPRPELRSSSSANTEESTVLLASLDGHAQAQLEREYSLVGRTLQHARAPVRLTLARVASPHELREQLLRHRPQQFILRASRPVDPPTHTYLFRLLATLWDWPRCLVLIAPHGNALARALQGTAEYIIGLDTRLPDSFVDEFLTAFLTNTARGRPVLAAFELAAAAADLHDSPDEEHDTPVLVTRYHPPGLKTPRP